MVRQRRDVPVVRVQGGDRFQFVRNMGTNAFRAGVEGGVQSVFTSATGRVVDVVTAFGRGGGGRLWW